MTARKSTPKVDPVEREEPLEVDGAIDPQEDTAEPVVLDNEQDAEESTPLPGPLEDIAEDVAEAITKPKQWVFRRWDPMLGDMTVLYIVLDRGGKYHLDYTGVFPDIEGSFAQELDIACKSEKSLEEAIQHATSRFHGFEAVEVVRE